MKMLIDAKTGKPFEGEDPIGISGSISWNRLIREYLKYELTDGEQFTVLVVTERGIEMRVERKPDEKAAVEDRT